MTSRFNVLKHSGYLLGARLFVRLASVPFLIYVAATLGPSLFGVFTFVLATVEMVSSLGDFGLSRYGTRVLVREQHEQSRFAGMLLTLQMLTSVLLAAAGLAAVLVAQPGSPKMQVLLLGLLTVLLSAFTYTSETVFTATKRFGASALFSVIGRVIYLALGFTALMFDVSVVLVMWAFVASIMLESVMRMVYAWIAVTPFSFHFTFSDLKVVARGTVPFAATAISSLIYFRADTVILEFIKGDADVGIYSAAYSYFSFFMWFPIVLSRALLPTLVARFRDDPDGAELTSWYWYRAVGVAGVAIAFAMTVLAGPIIRALMPDAYDESVIVLQILMWSIPTLMMVSMSFNSLTVANRERTGANTSIITAALIVALDVLLIFPYGPRGAAAAMVITTAIWEGMTHWLMSRHVLGPRHGLITTFSMPVLGGGLMTAAALAVWAAGLGTAATLVAGLAVYGAVVLVIRSVEHRYASLSF